MYLPWTTWLILPFNAFRWSSFYSLLKTYTMLLSNYYMFLFCSGWRILKRSAETLPRSKAFLLIKSDITSLKASFWTWQHMSLAATDIQNEVNTSALFHQNRLVSSVLFDAVQCYTHTHTHSSGVIWPQTHKLSGTAVIAGRCPLTTANHYID